MSVTIVTGASQNHFRSLCQFLRSVPNAGMDVKCYVYDLGLDENSVKYLHSEFPSYIHKTFDYSKYPSYFDINIAAGEYAWKPALILEVAKEVTSGYLMWFDAGDIIETDLRPLLDIIKKQGIYSAISANNVKHWTHQKMLDFFCIPPDAKMLEKDNRNAAMLGFDLDSEKVMRFVHEFGRLACIRECIAPIGSNLGNHRQDQALFTVLYYFYFGDTPTCGDYVGYKIHCDIG